MAAAGTNPTSNPIEARSLRVQYGAHVAVAELDLFVRRGEVVALLGPNGAGKTSTVEALEGYRRPSAGTARILGLDPIADKRRVVPKLGVMLQGGGVYSGMAPRAALKLFASYYSSPEGPEALLELLGLQRVARTPWRRLSGGEQQRLSLALALVGRPEVAVLDEPTSGVDPEGRQAMRRVISDLRERGGCVLLTTHELDEVERLADRAYIISQGRVAAEGTLDELAAMAGPGHVRWASTPGLDFGRLEQDIDAVVREGPPGSYVALAPGTPDNVGRITAWLSQQGAPLNDLRAGRAPLEEIYLRLTRQGPQ
ncbi:MAG TPA: ABC transporter ATP-binding protein [Acidimicrobiales bacterium]|nr:ABC transporter ATP-binding protein [Acidimicrobiales bacterium]